MNTIIVSVDFTKESKERASFALDMAKRFNSKIIFAHAHNVIFQKTAIGTPSPLSNSGGINRLTQQMLKEQELTKFVNNLNTSVVIENYVGVGSMENVLSDLIDKEDADLVVIGTSEESSIERLLLGNTNEKISRKVTCSVLILPDKAKKISLDDVSLALDAKWFENDVQMDILFNFLRVYGSELKILHVAKDDKQLLKEKQVLEHHGTYLNRLKNYSFHTVHDDNAKNGIINFLQKQSSDLLAIVYRGHGFFKRIFDPGVRKQIISDIEMPLLILK
ncbi:hypothetical protein MTsPCn9_08920 [Croceitalea sp. MTPC9]|nr:hypothetical protein MTsPCn6_34070 [Croceitalea sp. MTPC6]GMN15956.1 hypothetical protein MTsPCn9_08920 [Croceitalea sp. MTPC9]